MHVKDATWMPAKMTPTTTGPAKGKGVWAFSCRTRSHIGITAAYPFNRIWLWFFMIRFKANDGAMCKNFVEYGRRVEKLIAEVK
jgi:hypothetical protein